MENPIKMDDLGGPALFLENPPINPYELRWFPTCYFLCFACVEEQMIYGSELAEKKHSLLKGAVSKLGAKHYEIHYPPLKLTVCTWK